MKRYSLMQVVDGEKDRNETDSFTDIDMARDVFDGCEHGYLVQANFKPNKNQITCSKKFCSFVIWSDESFYLTLYYLYDHELNELVRR